MPQALDSICIMTLYVCLRSDEIKNLGCTMLCDACISNRLSLHHLTLNLVGVKLSDVGVSLELLLGEREPLRVVRGMCSGTIRRSLCKLSYSDVCFKVTL